MRAEIKKRTSKTSVAPLQELRVFTGSRDSVLLLDALADDVDGKSGWIAK